MIDAAVLAYVLLLVAGVLLARFLRNRTGKDVAVNPSRLERVRRAKPGSKAEK